MLIKNVAITGNVEKINEQKVVDHVANSFLKNKFNISTINPIKFKNVSSLDIKEIDQTNIDLLCILGGDGTIIGTIRSLSKQIPILGVNVGSKGVLTDIFPDEIDLAIEAIKKNMFIIQERLMLKVTLRNQLVEPRVLNEAFFYRQSLTKLPLYLIVQGSFYIKKKMDGLIISTPTGSTGHSFSLSGPIVDETLHVFLLNPVGSIQRLPPIIVPPSPMKISCSDRAVLILDGQIKYDLNKNEEVLIEESEERAKLVRVLSGRLSQIEKLGFDIIG
ncbi:MAG: NAD(+)/NADH kinase [Nitrososphaeria archaeon]